MIGRPSGWKAWNQNNFWLEAIKFEKKMVGNYCYDWEIYIHMLAWFQPQILSRPSHIPHLPTTHAPYPRLSHPSLIPDTALDPSYHSQYSPASESLDADGIGRMA